MILKMKVIAERDSLVLGQDFFRFSFFFRDLVTADCVHKEQNFEVWILSALVETKIIASNY